MNLTVTRFSFKRLMGTVPWGVWTAEAITAASVSVKKEHRSTLGISDQIKLSCANREGGG